MKKLLLASFATLAVLSGSALAADLPARPTYKAAAPMPAPVYNWTGCYVDGGFGYALYTQDHYGESFPSTGSVTPSSTTGGRGWYGQAGGGCDYQFTLGNLGNFIVGVLADYDFMSIKGNIQTGFGDIGQEKQTNTWVAGGRIGYLVNPNVLTYFSGGYTQAKFNSMTFVNNPGLTLPSHNYTGGWFLGGGTEMSLSSWLPTGFFLRSEYRYSSFKAADLQYSFLGVPLSSAENMKKYEQMLGTELIYRFNWH